MATVTPASTSTPIAASFAYKSLTTPTATIFILSLLLLVGVIAVLAIRAFRAKIGQRRGQGAFEEAYKREYYEEAIEAYRRALSRNPLDADALRGMGNALYALERYRKALDAFMQAVNHDPISANYAGLGNVYAELKQYNEAVAAYEKAIELDPTVTFNYDGFIQSFQAVGKKAEAEQAYARAKQLDYDDESN